jgi:hypothetical protein
MLSIFSSRNLKLPRTKSYGLASANKRV